MTTRTLRNHYSRCNESPPIIAAAPPRQNDNATLPHVLPSNHLSSNIVSNAEPISDSPDENENENDPAYACPLGEKGDLVEDATLKRSGFIINKRFSLLICTACEYAVRPSEASSHIKVQHADRGLDPLPEATVLSFCEEFTLPSPVILFPKPTTVIPPVAGIKIVDGYVCEGCGYALASYKAMRKHSNQCPEGEASKIRGALLQMAFGRGGEGHCYFEVERTGVHTTLPHLVDARNIVHQALKKNKTPVKSDRLQDVRDRALFLSVMRWDVHVAPFSSSALFALVAAPSKAETIYTRLNTEIRMYIDKTNTVVKTCPVELLQDLVSGSIEE